MKHKSILACICAVSALLGQLSMTASACDLSADQLTEKYGDAFLRVMKDGYPDMSDDDSESVYDSKTGMLSKIIYNEHCVLNVSDQTFSYGGKLYQNFYYVINDDETVTIVGTAYQALARQNTRELIIPSAIEGLPVKEIGSAAFKALGDAVPTLTSIKIPNTVTKINSYAFDRAFSQRKGCSIQIPDSVEYLGHLCFGELDDALGDTVTLPETLEYADYCAFGTYTEIKELNLPKSNVVCLPGMLLYGADGRAWFESCTVHPVAQAYLENAQDENVSEILERAVAEWRDTLPETAKKIDSYQNMSVAVTKTASVPGDIDQNGSTNIADAVLLARFIAEDSEVSVTAAGIEAADLDGDGSVTAADLADLLERIASVNG